MRLKSVLWSRSRPNKLRLEQRTLPGTGRKFSSATFRLAHSKCILALAVLFAAATLACRPSTASAEALLLVDAATGKVLHAENATYPWYPASLSKLMTTYVTLQAVNEHRISLDTLITVSELASEQQPSKMGFPPGTQLTVDNALKIMMVKSANDIAVTLAEGVDGSVEKFAEEMNATAQRLGMTQTHYDNPNGLPDPGQITSARDLAILARALIHDFPEYSLYWHIPAIKFGRRVMRNFNPLIDRYPGADGMKTGFICASGFNLVATATRHGQHLIAVVLGAPSSAARAQRAAQLLESGFNSMKELAWLTPSLGTVDSLKPIAAAPPNLYDETCGPHRHRRTAESDEDEGSNDTADTSHGIALSSLQTPSGDPLIGPLIPSSPPIVVTVVPPKKPPKTVDVPIPPERRQAKSVNLSAEPITKTAPTLARSGSLPASSFSASSLASNPPAIFAEHPLDSAVPLPRPRPHLRHVRFKKRR